MRYSRREETPWSLREKRRGLQIQSRRDEARQVETRPPDTRACKTCLCSNGRYGISWPSDSGDETSRHSGRAGKTSDGVELGDSDAFVEERRPRGAQVGKMEA